MAMAFCQASRALLPHDRFPGARSCTFIGVRVGVPGLVPVTPGNACKVHKQKETDSMAANETDAALDQAVTILQGGVERPEMEGALRVIETWEQRLAASESPELIPISDNLADLRIQLLAGDSDPAAVGQLLITLGEQVGSVAESDIGAPVADKLLQLSALLTDQGNALANR